ncbi:MAG: hypothetical protein K2I66_06170 [Bacteroidales bacterium]|nr:hypothetical protein [Bacteroidales bacterium]
MKNAELKIHIIELLEPVVARVEELVESESAPDAEVVTVLKNDLRALYDAVCEVERTEVEQPENAVSRMRNSVSELKRKLMLVSKDEEPAPVAEDAAPAVAKPEPEPVAEESAPIAEEFTPIVDTPEPIVAEPEPVVAEPEPVVEEPAFEPVFEEPVRPEPDLSAFMPDERDEPTSYVTQITAMVQAKAEQQDMSNVAVSSTAMPDPEIEKQMANRSDIFTRLQEETRKINSDDPQNALRTLVEKMKSGKTVNEAYQGGGGNIKALIGLNEKFLLLNQLFKGNIKEYNEFLQDIDKQENHEEAMQILDLYRERYQWNVEELPYVTLQDMIGKLFPER